MPEKKLLKQVEIYAYYQVIMLCNVVWHKIDKKN